LIQKNTKGKQSLDNLMFDLRAISRNNKVISEGLFVSLVNHYTGFKMDSLHHTMINKGALIPVFKESLGPMALSETKLLGAFDVGFDFEASWQEKKVQGLKENSAAWHAGLRNGQKVKGYSIQHNDISKQVEIKIEENGVERMISYYPMSAAKTEVPQFRLK
jgi:predicted metalloprotease with PDZ domain